MPATLVVLADPGRQLPIDKIRGWLTGLPARLESTKLTEVPTTIRSSRMAVVIAVANDDRLDELTAVAAACEWFDGLLIVAGITDQTNRAVLDSFPTALVLGAPWPEVRWREQIRQAVQASQERLARCG